MDFVVPADHRVKLKEGEKRDKYLDMVRKLKMLRNMKVTVIPIVVGALGMIPKGTGRLRNQKTSKNHLDYSFTKNT